MSVPLSLQQHKPDTAVIIIMIRGVTQVMFPHRTFAVKLRVIIVRLADNVLGTHVPQWTFVRSSRTVRITRTASPIHPKPAT